MSENKSINPKDVLAVTRLPLGLTPDTLVAFASLGFLEGALKYGRYNWRLIGVSSSILHDAIRRHLARWWAGEECDKKTGVPHLASILASAGILLDAKVCGKLNDDRPPRAPISEMIDAMEADVARLRQVFVDKSPVQPTIADSK